MGGRQPTPPAARRGPTLQPPIFGPKQRHWRPWSPSQRTNGQVNKKWRGWANRSHSRAPIQPAWEGTLCLANKIPGYLARLFSKVVGSKDVAASHFRPFFFFFLLPSHHLFQRKTESKRHTCATLSSVSSFSFPREVHSCHTLTEPFLFFPPPPYIPAPLPSQSPDPLCCCTQRLKKKQALDRNSRSKIVRHAKYPRFKSSCFPHSSAFIKANTLSIFVLTPPLFNWGRIPVGTNLEHRLQSAVEIRIGHYSRQADKLRAG